MLIWLHNIFQGEIGGPARGLCGVGCSRGRQWAARVGLAHYAPSCCGRIRSRPSGQEEKTGPQTLGSQGQGRRRRGRGRGPSLLPVQVPAVLQRDGEKEGAQFLLILLAINFFACLPLLRQHYSEIIVYSLDSPRFHSCMGFSSFVSEVVQHLCSLCGNSPRNCFLFQFCLILSWDRAINFPILFVGIMDVRVSSEAIRRKQKCCC